MPRALTMRKIEGKPGVVYYPLSLDEVPAPKPGPNDVTVAIHTCALNHRDLFLRQSLYPAPSFTTPLLADGCGTITAAPPSQRSLLGKRVMLTPGHGWVSAADGPERPYAILGGTSTCLVGTAQDVACVDAGEVEIAPEHLSDAEAAALPLTGLTAWRAFVTKSENAEAGRNILVTGIGGGVALNVLQFAVAMGCRVFVTSGKREKIEKAKAMGAVGGVVYKEKGWEKELLGMLGKERPFIDAIIDGAGGDVMAKGVKLMKHGGVVVSYGMTINPKMEWSMNATLKNLELRGSTMGSRKEFKEMVAFVREKKIVPIVSRVVKGLDNIKDIDGLFDEMKVGSQFGKLVIEIAPSTTKASKL